MTTPPRKQSLLTLAALGLALWLAGCHGDRSEPNHVLAGSVDISASVTPREPRVGENQMWIELRDADGKPIGDAQLEVAVRMPSMGAMPAMGGPASVAALGGGRFRADFTIDMSAKWSVEIRVTRANGETASVDGSLSIGTPGVRLEAQAAAEGEPGTGSRSPGVAPPAQRQLSNEPRPGEFQFDESRLRQVGIRSEAARREPLAVRTRALGRLAWDERELREVTLRVSGFAGSVEASALGDRVEKGQVLFQLYSPELWTAQQEYLQALRSRVAAQGTGAPDRADALVRATERRLLLWGIDPRDVARIAARGTAEEYLPVRAPTSGYVIEKAVIAGASLEMGQRVYRIAPLDRIWIDAEVYESEMEEVAVGQPATVTLPYHPGMELQARVAYLYPALQGERRTLRVRLELANPEGALRPDMYADVFLERPLGTHLTVPDSAVLHAGDKSFVFVDLGGGRLRPQRVTVGHRADGRLEILSGLEEGQPVVTSGTFLVSGESRLRAALDSWQ